MSGGGSDNSGMYAMMQQQNQQSSANAAADLAFRREQAERAAEQQQRYELQQQQAAANANRMYLLQQRQQEQQQRQDRYDTKQQAYQQRHDETAARYRDQAQARAQQRHDDEMTRRAQARQDELARRAAVTQQRTARNDMLRERAQTRADTLQQRKATQQFNNKRNTAYTNARNSMFNQLHAAGIEGDTHRALSDALLSAYNSIPDGAANPSAYFSGIYDDVLAQQQDAYTNKLTGKYDSMYGTDYSRGLVADTADDSVIEEILGGQYNDAQAQAQRLLDRGAITQEGYDANIKALSGQRDKGRGTLSAIGDNLLSSQRSAIDDILNSGRTAAMNAKLGSGFKIADTGIKAKASYDDFMKGLGTKFKGLAPTDLFDTSDFLNTAGSVAGPTNSPFVGSTNALTGDDASAIDPTKKKKDTTTTSSVGAF